MAEKMGKNHSSSRQGAKSAKNDFLFFFASFAPFATLRETGLSASDQITPSEG